MRNTIAGRPSQPQTRPWALLLITVLSLILASCGGDGTSGSSTTAESDDATSPTEATATTLDEEGDPTTTVAPDAEADTEAALIDAAVSEGSLRVDFLNSEEGAAEYSAAFTAAYPGIDVSFRTMNSTDLRTIQDQEIAAGQESFDVTVFTNPEHSAEWSSQGLLTDLTDLPHYDLLPEGFQSGDRITFAQGPILLAYNSDRVDPADLPTSWEDVIDPRWQGVFGIPDPSRCGGIGLSMAVLEQQYGMELIQGWADNQPKLYPSATPGVQALAAGDIDLMVLAGMPPVLRAIDEGAPVGFAPTEVIPTSPVEFGVYAEAENPSAGRLFVDWIATSEEAAEINTKYGYPGIYVLDDPNMSAIHPALSDIDPQWFVLPDLSSLDPAICEDMGRVLGFS